ncbi:MAG TPA: hypothetical protein ENL08_01910 [Bacteroidetes bacterium]|nr:hypothetical protein [Bacteroidota bacterium]
MTSRLTGHAGQVVLAASLFVFSFGCVSDPLDHAEELIAAYDFKSALAVLDQMTGAEREDMRFVRLHAVSLFVEGNIDEGFAELDSIRSDDPASQLAAARALYEAAVVIIREKNRIREAITLLDSCRTWDPDLKQKVQSLVWNRALEYFSVPGDGGYQLIQFASRLDEGIVRRLRSFNRLYYNRYNEMRGVYQALNLLKNRVELFRNNNQRLPVNYRELGQGGFTAGVAVPKGWKIELSREGKDRCILTAEARKNNLGKVLPGSILKEYVP